VLGPGGGAIADGEVFDGLFDGEPPRARSEADLAFEGELRARSVDGLDERVAAGANRVSRSGALAVHGEACGGLLIRGPAEKVEAEVVAEDSGQQAAFGIAAVFGMARRIVGGRLDGRPRRRPERIHAGGLVADDGNVAAFDADYDFEEVVFEGVGLAVAVDGLWHGFRCIKKEGRPARLAGRPWLPGTVEN